MLKPGNGLAEGIVARAAKGLESAASAAVFWARRPELGNPLRRSESAVTIPKIAFQKYLNESRPGLQSRAVTGNHPRFALPSFALENLAALEYNWRV